MQQAANKVGCQNLSEFQAKVVSLVQNVPQRMLANLYASMKDRLVECISKGGEKTRY